MRVNICKKVFFMLIGSLLFACGLEVFLIPNDVIDGGIVGISIMTAHYTKIKLGILLIVLNSPFLILAYKQLGKKFAFYTLFSIVMGAIFTQLFHYFHVEPLTKDPLLAAVFGGIILGIGVGTVIKNGGSLDGTEILAILFNKKLPFSVGEVVMFFNFFILGSAGFVFGWDRAMYSILAYIVAYKAIDITVEGLDQTRSVWIISDVSEAIGDALQERLGRSVTYLNGVGGYTKEDKKVIFCICTRLEETILRDIIEEIDPNAFVAIGHIHDVEGGKFKRKDVH